MPCQGSCKNTYWHGGLKSLVGGISSATTHSLCILWLFAVGPNSSTHKNICRPILELINIYYTIEYFTWCVLSKTQKAYKINILHNKQIQLNNTTDTINNLLLFTLNVFEANHAIYPLWAKRTAFNHAFGDNSAESKPIWIKSRTVWSKWWGWPWQILCPMRSVATVWEKAETFCPVNNADLHFNTTTSIGEAVKTFGTEFWKIFHKGSLKKCKTC